MDILGISLSPMKTKLVKAIPIKDFQDWEKEAKKMDGILKGNLSEYIRRATNYCAKNKIKL